jgi:hypothetical protein
MSDLTKALWLISEKSTTLFAKGETSFHPQPTARNTLHFLHFNNQQSSLDNHQSVPRDPVRSACGEARWVLDSVDS